MIVTRFAPSPTGYLHLGHAFAAKFAYDKAKESGGRFLLRIEDIDPVRCKPEFTDVLMEDLDWLGLHWDGEPLIQSEHMDYYDSLLTRLKAEGLLYPCVCTRKDIEAENARIGHAPHAGETAVYPGTCRGKRLDLSRYDRYSWRLDVGKAMERIDSPLTFCDETQGETLANPAIFGDIVLARKDTPASYHLCSVADDARQGVTLVTRGIDLFDSTHIHRLLQELLGFNTPKYVHHGLVCNENGQRLEKRNKAVTIRSLRENGLNPDEIFDLAGRSVKI